MNQEMGFHLYNAGAEQLIEIFLNNKDKFSRFIIKKLVQHYENL